MERKTNGQIRGLLNKMWLILLHNTTYHYQAMYQISEVVDEKSLTEKSLQTDKQMHTITEKAKTIYLLYTEPKF